MRCYSVTTRWDQETPSWLASSGTVVVVVVVVVYSLLSQLEVLWQQTTCTPRILPACLWSVGGALSRWRDSTHHGTGRELNPQPFLLHRLSVQSPESSGKFCNSLNAKKISLEKKKVRFDKCKIPLPPPPPPPFRSATVLPPRVV